jgi:hypothetical protein
MFALRCETDVAFAVNVSSSIFSRRFWTPNYIPLIFKVDQSNTC